MRRTFILGFATLLLLAASARAQENAAEDSHKYEVFAGYSYLRGDFGQGHKDLGGGGILEGVYRFNNRLAAVGEWSTHHDSKSGVDVDSNLFLFGPRVYFLRHKRFQPFAHALFGFHATQVGFPGQGSVQNENDTGFVFAPGGGLDIAVSKRFAIRALQADYLVTDVNLATGPNRSLDQFTDNIRLSTGIVFRWGR